MKKWILEGDIKSCFDKIHHEWLLENVRMDKEILRKFLKAGYVYKKQLFRTKEGTPQGGIISPILANIALDGIEYLLKNKYWRGAQETRTILTKNNYLGINYVRYADDFIVTAKSKEALE